MSSTNDMNAFVTDLMSRMTLEEKIGQMNLTQPSHGDGEDEIVTGEAKNNGTEEKIRQGLVGSILNARRPHVVRRYQKIAMEESRLKIPLIFALDVIHGHVTAFPTPLALSSSWNMDLIQETARLAAREAVTDGIKQVYSPMVDIARDPRWGRIAEGSGEDPYLGSRIAEAMVRGYQGDDLSAPDSVMACLKHFAAYGAAEAGRDYNTVDMSRLKLQEVILPPFKAGVKAGAGSIMNAFNDLNGVPASADKWLMTDVAREDWGFDGFFVSDFTGINEMIKHGVGDLKAVSALAVKAGLDMDMVGEGYLTTLKQSIEDGSVSMDDVDRACRKILEAKYKLGLFDNPYYGMDPANPEKIHLAPETRAVAREAVVQSCVLLKNDNAALPLKRAGTIALIGPLANDKRNIPGMWAGNTNIDACVSIMDGLVQSSGGKANILYAKGANITDDLDEVDRLNIFEKKDAPVKNAMVDPRSPADMLAEAVAVASQADVIVAVVGESKEHTGEASSRTSLDLPQSQRTLIDALHKTAQAAGKPLVLVIMGSRPLTLGWERDHSDAMLMAWHGGTEMGHGVADLLFGDRNPSGKLTVTFPRNVGQIPIYYAHKTTGRPLTADGNDAGEWKKFRSAYLDSRNDPEFPFGFGLSYTRFDYSPVKVSKDTLTGNQKLKASVTLTNMGTHAGEETVQLYITDPVCTRTRPVKELKGFQKISLQPGEKKDVTFDITTEDLKFFITENKFGWEPGDFIIHIGTNAQDTQTATVRWEKAVVKKQSKPEPKI